MTAEELLGSYDGIVQTDGWGLMVRENICTQAAGRTLAASLWTAYLKMIKTAKRQKLSDIIDRAFAWRVKQESKRPAGKDIGDAAERGKTDHRRILQLHRNAQTEQRFTPWHGGHLCPESERQAPFVFRFIPKWK